MWQVNGFDRRCFQVGRGYRILPDTIAGSTSEVLGSHTEIHGLIQRAQKLSSEGSHTAAVEACAEAVTLGRRLRPENLELLAETLRCKATLQRRQAQLESDGPTQHELLKTAEQQIEREAGKFHEAKFSRGVALMRLALAQIDLQRGGLCRCSSAAELAGDAMAELTDGATLLEAKLLRAAALLACGDPKAQADAQEVLDKSRGLGDRRSEAMALQVFGLSKALQGTVSAYEEALRHLSSARNLCSELALWNCHASVELGMARLYLESQQASEAIQVAEEALVLIQDMGDVHSEYLAYGLLCQALLETDQSQAEGRAREAVDRFKAKGPRPHALALNLLAGVLSETKLSQARKAAEEALQISRRMGDGDLEAQIWLRLSSIEAAGEKDDETLQALENAMELWKKLPERSEAIACARYLSISVLLRMFDPKDSLKEASQVRAFFAEEKDAHREALTLVAVASVSFARNDVEDAKESLELARELFREVSDYRGEMLALTTLAEMARSMGEISEASELMQRCRAMAKETGWKEEEIRILVDLSNLERSANDNVKSSARLAREGLRLAKHVGDVEGQVQLLMQCVQCQLLLASAKPPSRNLLEETQRLAADAVRLTGELGSGGWRRRLKGLALYWQAHSVALRDTSDALKHIEALVDYCRSTENVGLEAHARLLEAQIHLSSDKAKALEILRPAAETLKKLGDVNGMEMAQQVLQRASPPQPARPALEAPSDALEQLAPAPAAAAPAAKLDQHSVRKLILDLATEAVASEAPLQDDSVLMDLGMDSLTSVAFRNDLQSKFGMELPASLIFDYPSVGKLTKLVLSLADQ